MTRKFALPPSWPQGVALVWVLLALSMALYWGALWSPPIWDDHAYVIAQPFFSDWRNIKTFFSTDFLSLPISNAARPVWLLSILIDRLIFGDSFTALRASNQLWHVLGAALLAVFAHEFSASRAAAAAAGVLFVCHAAHTEPVNFVTFRADLIAFAGVAAGLVFLLRARRAGRSRGLWAASALCFAAGLLAKESASCFPALAAAVWTLAQERVASQRRRAAAAFALALLVVFAAYLAYRVPRSGYRYRNTADELTRAWQGGPDASMERRDLPEAPSWWKEFEDPGVRLRTTLAAHAGAFATAVWPWPLQGDYQPRLSRGWGEPGPWLGLAAWLGLLLGAWLLRRKSPLAALGLAWTALAYLPTSGLVMLHNLRADRYLYISSAGVCLAAAASLAVPGLSAAARLRRLAALGTLAACWAAMTVLRNRDYESDAAFHAATVARDGSVARARFNLAVALDVAGRPEEAMPHLEEALRIEPGSRRMRFYRDALRMRTQAR